MPEDRAAFYLNERGAGVLELFLLTLALPCLFVALGPSKRPESSPLLNLSENFQRILLAVVTTGLLMAPGPISRGILIGACISAGLLRFPAQPHASAFSTSPSTLSYVSSAKAALLLYTAASILAVDFPAFPRRYAKTDRTGTGEKSHHLLLFSGAPIH